MCAEGGEGGSSASREDEEMTRMGQALANLRLQTFQMENQLMKRLLGSENEMDDMEKELAEKIKQLPELEAELQRHFDEHAELSRRHQELEEKVAELEAEEKRLQRAAKRWEPSASASSDDIAPCFRVTNETLNGGLHGGKRYLAESRNRLLVATTHKDGEYWGYSYNDPQQRGYFRATDTRPFRRTEFDATLT
eukprot:symbB.v1.2.004895.t1/scaffold277.1/size415908/14